MCCHYLTVLNTLLESNNRLSVKRGSVKCKLKLLRTVCLGCGKCLFSCYSLSIYLKLAAVCTVSILNMKGT